jgi:hypothetical protein
MNQRKMSGEGYRSRTFAGVLRLLSWNVAWLAATWLMRFGPVFFWKQASALTWLGVGLDVVVGVGMVLATKKYVMGLDELQQKVYLNALGITVGVAVVAGVAAPVMSLYHVISFHAEIWHLVLLMGLTFIVSFAYGNWRYR